MTSATEDREFLVAYDYGMGRLWAFARAPSEADLLNAFPELTVVHERPNWLDPIRESEMRSSSTFVIGAPSTYPEWLQLLIDERSR